MNTGHSARLPLGADGATTAWFPSDAMTQKLFGHTYGGAQQIGENWRSLILALSGGDPAPSDVEESPGG